MNDHDKAVERHEERRAAIQQALADIPRKLDKIQRQASLSYRTPQLDRAADAVLVAIFVVLERIIDWLLKSWLGRPYQFQLIQRGCGRLPRLT